MNLIWTMSHISVKLMYFKRSYQLQLVSQHCSLPPPKTKSTTSTDERYRSFGRVENIDHCCPEYINIAVQYWASANSLSFGVTVWRQGSISEHIWSNELTSTNKTSLNLSLSHFQVLFQDTCAVLALGSATLLKTIKNKLLYIDPWFISWWFQQLKSHHILWLDD